MEIFHLPTAEYFQINQIDLTIPKQIFRFYYYHIVILDPILTHTIIPLIKAHKPYLKLVCKLWHQEEEN